MGFRETTEDDQAKLTQWLAEAVVVARCRNERIEPPTPGQVRRLVASAVRVRACF
ncbi:DUF4158 domain-containing protein [Kitasatospora mediocidica]|uniref:hypothetical protein n=1 Tax=Kitasatospora mediocidica TaxID=58352 RepID=UPI000A998E97|nr:hypothetical protein [Kitasatospora mediocidica]